MSLKLRIDLPIEAVYLTRRKQEPKIADSEKRSIGYATMTKVSDVDYEVRENSKHQLTKLQKVKSVIINSFALFLSFDLILYFSAGG